MQTRVMLIAITACVLALAAARPAEAQSDKEQVLAAIDAFLVGLRTKDTALMLRHVDSATRFTLLRPTRDGGLRVVVYSAREFMTNVHLRSPSSMQLEGLCLRPHNIVLEHVSPRDSDDRQREPQKRPGHRLRG